jgi:hypothetical protein
VSNVRVRIDDGAWQQVRHAAAAGLLAVGEAVIERANPPDAPAYGQGLVNAGAAGAWVDGVQVGGEADMPRQLEPGGIVGAVGYPFPARFQEEGTVHQPARPFLTPAAMSVAPDAPRIATEAAARVVGGRS